MPKPSKKQELTALNAADVQTIIVATEGVVMSGDALERWAGVACQSRRLEVRWTF